MGGEKLVETIVLFIAVDTERLRLIRIVVH
jgi:hypothetical protein